MKKLICVDDDPDIVAQYKAIFQNEGFEVHEGGSGADLGCLLRDIPDFDVIVLDLSMPVLNGVTTLRRLEQNDPYVLARTIVVSGLLTTELSENLQKMGVEQMSKPVSFRKLIERVHALAGNKPPGATSAEKGA